MTRLSNQQLFLAIWAIAMVLSIQIAQNAGRLFSQSGKPVAYLARSKGKVQFRSSDAYLWVDTSKLQRFQDGSVVATGSDSAAEIALPGGRSLSVGANSQVVIEHHKEKSQESEYVITVVKGEVNEKARAKPGIFAAKPPSIAIRLDEKFTPAVIGTLPELVSSETKTASTPEYFDIEEEAPLLLPAPVARVLPPYSLRLAAKGDTTRLTALMGGADLFQIATNRQTFSDHGRFLVKGSKIIGELKSWREPVPWTRIAAVLGLDLAFEGRQGAWLGSTLAKGEEAALPEQLFVATDAGELVAVNRSLLSRHPDATDLIARGKGLFSERVQLLGQSIEPASALPPDSFAAGHGSDLKVIFLDEVPDDGLPSLKTINESTFNSFGWLASSHFDQTQLDLLLNRRLYRQKLRQLPTEEARISLILKICAANIAVFTPASGDWAMFLRRGGVVQRIEAGDRPSGKLSERKLHEWIMGRLGFDGVVAEQSGDYLRVIGSLPSPTKHRRQGLVLRDSTTEPLIADIVATKPSALIEYVRPTDDGAIYRVLMPDGDGEQTPIGSKILLE